MKPPKSHPDTADMIAAYAAGEPLQRIALRYNVSRPWLTRRLKESGLEIRSYSDAQRSRWKYVPSSKRRQVVKQTLGKAWEARRGNTDSADRKAKRALTRMLRQSHIAPREVLIASYLTGCGIALRQPQFAFGPYNIDISLEQSTVAVEVSRSP
jgi:hypothetical protein